MQRKRETHLSRQANRCATHESNHMVAQDRMEARVQTAYYLFLAATLLYGFLILLHDQSII